MGNGDKMKIKFIGTIKLKLESRYCLKLFYTIYVPSIRCSSIFSRLDKPGYSRTFGDCLFPLIVESRIAETSVLNGGYKC